MYGRVCNGGCGELDGKSLMDKKQRRYRKRPVTTQLIVFELQAVRRALLANEACISAPSWADHVDQGVLQVFGK